MKAVGTLGAHAEIALTKSSEIWAIAIDFQKLYIMLAPSVAATVAKHMGLTSDAVNVGCLSLLNYVSHAYISRNLTS